MTNFHDGGVKILLLRLSFDPFSNILIEERFLGKDTPLDQRLFGFIG